MNQARQRSLKPLVIFNVIMLGAPLPFLIYYSQHNRNIFDFVYTKIALMIFLAFLVVTVFGWGAKFALDAWARRKPDSSKPKAIKNALVGVGVMTGSLIFTLLIAELLSPIYLPNTYMIDLRKIHQIDPDPDLMFTPKPGAKMDIIEHWEKRDVHYEINELGFRGPVVEKKKPDNVIRVLAVGDSVTFGLDLNDEDTYPRILEEELNRWARMHEKPYKFEVINAGVGGYNTFNSVKLLEKKGLDYDPDIVIYQFCYNDLDDPVASIAAISLFHFNDLPDDLFPNPEMIARNQDIVLTVRRKSIGYGKSIFLFLLYHSRLFMYAHNNLGLLKPEPPKTDPNVELTEEQKNKQDKMYCEPVLEKLVDPETADYQWLKRHMEQVRDMTSARGISVVLLNIPLSYQLREGVPLFTDSYQAIDDLGKEMGFSVTSTRNTIRKGSIDEKGTLHESTLYNGTDLIHLNRAGNDVISIELMKTIIPLVEKMEKD